MTGNILTCLSDGLAWTLAGDRDSLCWAWPCVEMVFVMVPPGIVTVFVYLHKGQNRQICGTGDLLLFDRSCDWYSDSVSTSNVSIHFNSGVTEATLQQQHEINCFGVTYFS